MGKYSDVWCGASDDTGMDGSSCGYANRYGCGNCGQRDCSRKNSSEVENRISSESSPLKESQLEQVARIIDEKDKSKKLKSCEGQIARILYTKSIEWPDYFFRIKTEKMDNAQRILGKKITKIAILKKEGSNHNCPFFISFAQDHYCLNQDKIESYEIDLKK